MTNNSWNAHQRSMGGQGYSRAQIRAAYNPGGGGGHATGRGGATPSVGSSTAYVSPPMGGYTTPQTFPPVGGYGPPILTGMDPMLTLAAMYGAGNSRRAEREREAAEEREEAERRAEQEAAEERKARRRRERLREEEAQRRNEELQRAQEQAERQAAARQRAQEQEQLRRAQEQEQLRRAQEQAEREAAARQRAQEQAEREAAARQAAEEELAAMRARQAEELLEQERANTAAASAAPVVVGLNARALALGKVVQVTEAFLSEATEDFSVLLGEGSFGKVHLAVDVKLNLRFAVKRLHDEAFASGQAGTRRSTEQWLKSARREIEVLSCLKHPNIVRLLGFCWPGRNGAAAGSEPMMGEEDSLADHLARLSLQDATSSPVGRVSLLFEFAEGKSLDRHLHCDALASELGWEKRLRIAVGVACGLNYMHRSRRQEDGTPMVIYHRDVKAANVVLFGPLPTAKLIDCGLSVLLDKEKAQAVQQGRRSVATMTGQVAGTPPYMCPKLTGKLQGQEDVDFNDIEGDDEEGLLAADPRVEDWPQAVVKEIQSLGRACISRKPERRPSLLSALRRLNALSTASAAHTTSALVGMEEELEKVRRDAESWRARVAGDALLEQQQRRSCCLCLDEDCNALRGMECSPEQEEGADGAKHFVCGDCIPRAIEAAAADAAAGRGAGLRGLACPIAGCTSRPFTSHDFPREGLSEAAHRYEDMLASRVETATTEELEQQFQARLQGLRDELSAEAGVGVQVRLHRQHIVQQILTLHCPACGQAWVDFDACCALTCSRCDTAFCAWCGENCGEDAHRHVVHCPHNTNDGNLFASEEQFQQAQRARCIREVNAYLDSEVDSADVRRRVAEACRVDLEQLGIPAIA